MQIRVEQHCVEGVDRVREVIVTFFIGLLAFIILATVIMTIGFLLIKYTTITQIVLVSLFVLGIIFTMGKLVGEFF